MERDGSDEKGRSERRKKEWMVKRKGNRMVEEDGTWKEVRKRRKEGREGRRVDERKNLE